MNAAYSADRSAVNEPWNLSRSSSRKPSLGGRMSGTGAPGWGVGDQGVDRLALVGRECGEDDGRPGASNTSKPNDGISPAGVDLASSTCSPTTAPHSEFAIQTYYARRKETP